MNNKKRCIIGAKYIDEIKELESIGINCITINGSKKLDNEINSHTDILCFKLSNDIVLADSVTAGELRKKINDYTIIDIENIKSPYPYDVKLNTAFLCNRIICNSKYISNEILQYCINNNIEIINTKQGYTKCNLCIVNDNAVITEDEGLACLLKNYQIDVLKILPGYVALSEKHYGFISGASGKLDNNKIYFSGNILEHPDYDKIHKFLDKYNINPIYNNNRKLCDFGGFIML